MRSSERHSEDEEDDVDALLEDEDDSRGSASVSQMMSTKGGYDARPSVDMEFEQQSEQTESQAPSRTSMGGSSRMSVGSRRSRRRNKKNKNKKKGGRKPMAMAEISEASENESDLGVVRQSEDDIRDKGGIDIPRYFEM